MMKVMLINIDSTITNLALKKIEKYHIDKGDSVVWDFPLIIKQMDKVYVSCIFPENYNLCREYEGIADIGGTGYDMRIQLPEEIERIKPRINYGFTTRGCIRKCKFCFVPKKEGWIRPVGDIYDIWDGKSRELTLMDNNILALPEHFEMICKQLIKENIKVDFNQGLDFRLLTPELWALIKSIKFFAEKRFAYDDIAYADMVDKTLAMMRDNGLKDWESRWYVYVSKDDSIDNVYSRLELLRRHKQMAYLMQDKECDNRGVTGLRKWANSVGFKYKLSDVFDKSEDMNRYKPYIIPFLTVK